jgi:DNA-directed RNA polymerase specialized sigma24 family protein
VPFELRSPAGPNATELPPSESREPRRETLAFGLALEEDRPVKRSASPDVLAPPQSDGAPNRKKQKDPRTTFLANADHRGALLDFFARKGAGGDAEDLVQEVLIRVSESQNFPADEIQQVMYAFGIARNRIKDWYETTQHRRQLETLVARTADVPVAEAVDAFDDRELLGKLADGLSENEIPTWNWLARVLLGEKLRPIAREAGVDYDVAYKRVMTLHRRLKRQAIARAGLTILVGLFATVSVMRPRAPIAHKEQPVSTPSVVPPATPEVIEARRLREEAFRKCDPAEGDYRGCLLDLDRAKELDPAGDEDARVGMARNSAMQVLGEKSAPKDQSRPQNQRSPKTRTGPKD